MCGYLGGIMCGILWGTPQVELQVARIKKEAHPATIPLTGYMSLEQPQGGLYLFVDDPSTTATSSFKTD